MYLEAVSTTSAALGGQRAKAKTLLMHLRGPVVARDHVLSQHHRVMAVLADNGKIREESHRKHWVL